MKREDLMLRRVNDTLFSFAPPGEGRHNSLVVDTVELFGPHYSPKALILHLQDKANEVMIHETAYLEKVGIMTMPNKLLPDLILYQPEKQHLFFIAMTTSGGPFTIQRKQALEKHIIISPLRRIYVSAFFGYEDYQQVVSQIAWHSYAWLAHTPDHIIVHW